jgi:hypothetical protein
MTGLDERIKRQAEQIDITRIDGLKQEIEALLEQKENPNEKINP